MPIYEYECEACNHRKENFERKPADRLYAYCANCGKTSLRRVISAGYFKLKGKGFHKPGHN
jgi:putative FmdB family regulatory protein